MKTMLVNRPPFVGTNAKTSCNCQIVYLERFPLENAKTKDCLLKRFLRGNAQTGDCLRSKQLCKQLRKQLDPESRKD